MQWQKELYQYQEIPPPHCWQEVQKQLGDEPVSLGARLYEASELPPVQAWAGIEREISTTPVRPSAPVHTIRRPALSYAAAIAGFVLLGAVLLYIATQRSASIDVKDLAAGLTLSDSQKQQQEIVLPENQSAAEDDTPTAPSTALPSGQSAIVPDSRSKKPETGANVSMPGPEFSRSKASNAKLVYTDGNYIQIVQANGEVTRVSYKLAGMVKSMHGKAGSAVEQKKWMEKIDTWKSKLEQSAYVPSATNFFDIAGMIEMMEADNR